MGQRHSRHVERVVFVVLGDTMVIEEEQEDWRVAKVIKSSFSIELSRETADIYTYTRRRTSPEKKGYQ